MADSTSNLDLISVSQAQKETTANQLFNSASPATIYSNQASSTNLLTWGYYGGRFNNISVANGTVVLTGSATNYLVADIATGVVSVDTTTTDWNDTTNYFRLYSIVTNSTSVTSYEDYRSILSFTPTTQPYDIVAYYENAPDPNQIMTAIKFTRPVIFSEDFDGSQSFSETAAAATTIFDVTKNGSSVGSIVFAASASVGTFSTSASGDVTFNVGDTLKIIAPSPADANLTGVGITLKGSR